MFDRSQALEKARLLSQNEQLQLIADLLKAASDKDWQIKEDALFYTLNWLQAARLPPQLNENVINTHFINPINNALATLQIEQKFTAKDLLACMVRDGNELLVKYKAPQKPDDHPFATFLAIAHYWKHEKREQPLKQAEAPQAVKLSDAEQALQTQAAILANYISDGRSGNKGRDKKTHSMDDIKKEIGIRVSTLCNFDHLIYKDQIREHVYLQLLEATYSFIYKNKDHDKNKFFVRKNNFYTHFWKTKNTPPRSGTEQKHIGLLQKMYLEKWETLKSKMPDKNSADQIKRDSDLLKFNLSYYVDTPSTSFCKK